MNRFVTHAIAALALGGASIASQADPFLPTGTFADLSAFGDDPFTGDGIPTGNSMITQFTGEQGDIITIALSATQRFSNPPLTNDGAGTFTAQAGENFGLNIPASSTVLGATWNFSFFVDIAGEGQGGSTISDYGIKLFYDLDPTAGTDRAAMGVIDFTGTGGGGLRRLGGSQNANFGFLGTPGIPGITVPAFTAFDPFAAGEYSFAIVGQPTLGDEQVVAMNVIVEGETAEEVPVPATLALFGLGLAGLGFFKRKKA